MVHAIRLSGYQYQIFASRDTDARAEMRLYAEGGGIAGYAHFRSAAKALPGSERAPDGHVHLYFDHSDLFNVVDMLRNEAPVYLVWEDAFSTRLSTSPEPVGEGERL